MKYKLLSTAALLASLALVQSIPSMAQSPGGKGGGSPGAQPQGMPSQGAPERRDGAAEPSQPPVQRGNRAQSPEPAPQKQGQPQKKVQQKPEPQKQGQQKPEPRQRGVDQTTGQGRPEQSPPAPSNQGPDRSAPAQAQPTPPQGRTGAQPPAQPGQDASQGQAQPPQPADRGGSVNLSNEQRTRIRSTVMAGNNVPRVDRVNFSIRVGTVVPASVRVVVVPATLIELYPEWRGHHYFVVRDDIIIVDRDHRIVSVVAIGSGSGAQLERPGGDQAVVISLSSEEIRQVQVVLKQKGFVVDVDGVLGPRTRQAIIAFQRQQGFQATGEIDQQTSGALERSA